MKRYLIGLLALVVVASGCAGSGPANSGSGGAAFSSMSPQQKYSHLISSNQDATYHVSYNMTFDMNAGDSRMSGLLGMIKAIFENADIDLYSYKGDVKSVVSVSALGSQSVTATYPIKDSNYSVQCSESAGSSDLSCSFSQSSGLGSGNSAMSTTPSQDFSDDLDKINLSYEGKKTVAGRKCASFSVSMPPSLMNSSTVQGDVTGHLCVDMEKGFMSRMAMNMSMESSTGFGNNTTPANVFIEFKAKDYSEDVTASDLELPKNMIVDLKCDGGLTGRVYSRDFSGQADLDVNGEQMQKQISSGQIQTYNLTQYRTSGANSLNITAGGETYSDSCYHYDFGGLS
ncbi:MAG: hypothetical protein ABEJ87_00345 [Candidatus Nanohalobium sp.]